MSNLFTFLHFNLKKKKIVLIFVFGHTEQHISRHQCSVSVKGQYRPTSILTRLSVQLVLQQKIKLNIFSGTNVTFLAEDKRMFVLRKSDRQKLTRWNYFHRPLRHFMYVNKNNMCTLVGLAGLMVMIMIYNTNMSSHLSCQNLVIDHFDIDSRPLGLSKHDQSDWWCEKEDYQTVLY